MSIQKVISEMPENVRKEVEAEARAAGKSLEEFIEGSLTTQVSDEDLDGVSGGSNRVAANFGGAANK